MFAVVLYPSSSFFASVGIKLTAPTGNNRMIDFNIFVIGLFYLPSSATRVRRYMCDNT